jgi:AraC family transcriptional activator of mtrCDE
MDGISRMLRYTDLEATLELRCLLGKSTRMNVERYGIRQAPFHVLLDGECRVLVGDVELQMKAGDAVVIPNGAAHRIITPGSGPLTTTRETNGRSLRITHSSNDEKPVIDLFCGHFTVGPGAGSLLLDSLPQPLHASLGDTESGKGFLRSLAGLMRAEAEHDGPGSSVILSALSTALLALVLRSGAATTATAPLWTAPQDEDIANAIALVLDDPGQPWTIDRLAEAAMMSRATFQRRFRRDTGTTVGELVTRTRLASAARLLSSSGLTVSTIASTVGYRSESAFSRAFSAALGATPAKFRRENRRADSVSPSHPRTNVNQRQVF